MITDMQVAQAAKCVLRVFDGPLQGCEFVLSQRRTLFVVGPQETIFSAERPLVIPDDAIYVPLASGGCNFEVLLEDNGRSGCVVRVLLAGGPVERSVDFQGVVDLEGLRVAFRPADECWSEQLLAQEVAEPQARARKGRWWRGLAIAGAALVFVLGVVAVAWQAMRTEAVSSVEALVAGASGELAVLDGRDHKVYVFASSEREASWGRQALVRNGYAATQVLTRYDERRRLEAVLAEHFPQLAFHRLDLGEPARPKVLVSAQRSQVTDAGRKVVESTLKEAAPYIREVQLVSSDDDELVRLAEEGLQRLAMRYVRTRSEGGVSFVVEGRLEDAGLKALNSFIWAFDQQWGERFVRFSVELVDDWAKGKSFKYGPDGYVKGSPSSWYFSVPPGA